MLKFMAVPALAAVLLWGAPSALAPTSGSWQVDSRHSSAQLVTDGTTDFGKTKINFTLGFARTGGTLTLDDSDPSKSNLYFRLYPATSMASPIEEDGNFKAHWLENAANHTLICFHSKKVVRMPDGKLQATGDLVLTRVDRNVDATPSEAYSGPVYGSPMIHRVSREATFVFDLSPADKGSKGGEIVATSSLSLARENFPQLVRAAVGTYWPPLVEDQKCQAPATVGEDYRGFECTGTFMDAPGLPPAPYQAREDYPVSNFNAVVGNQLTMVLRLRLAPSATGAQVAGGL